MSGAFNGTILYWLVSRPEPQARLSNLRLWTSHRPAVLKFWGKRQSLQRRCRLLSALLAIADALQLCCRDTLPVLQCMICRHMVYCCRRRRCAARTRAACGASRGTRRGTCWRRARRMRPPSSGAARARATPGVTARSASRRRAPPARRVRAGAQGIGSLYCTCFGQEDGAAREAGASRGSRKSLEQKAQTFASCSSRVQMHDIGRHAAFI